ncbi:MAG TPA: hypothetical protein ENG48_12240 [Candidatus Atribacteria bacterium]|nr:hypothetical protein [Candidatus Atribacteria bacterium]
MYQAKTTIRNKTSKFSLAILFSLAIFILVSSAQATGSGDLEEELNQLETILNDSPDYSAFQKTMILNSAGELLESGVSFDDTKNIIEGHLNNSINAYSVKKSLDLILVAQTEGLPLESLINKIEEGLAKKVESDKIFSVVDTKLKNLQVASNILQQIEYDPEAENYEEIVEKLADSLEDGLSQNYLSAVVERGVEEDKSIEEITEVSEELGFLNFQALEMGLSPEVIVDIFNSAADSSTQIEEICVKIQDALEDEIAIASTQSSVKDTSADSTTDSNSGTDVSTQVEAPGPASAGNTPVQDSGTAPIDTDNSSGPPGPSENEDDNGTAPPEN